ncbi:MAG TPA: hypothetical protein VFU73_03200 [Actinocrinis sp.]|nr:hypothetical protein [Actinocrinis sp.]
MLAGDGSRGLSEVLLTGDRSGGRGRVLLHGCGGGLGSTGCRTLHADGGLRGRLLRRRALRLCGVRALLMCLMRLVCLMRLMNLRVGGFGAWGGFPHGDRFVAVRTLRFRIFVGKSVEGS